ncbi:Metal-dependent hydrolases of the beta-lactamase superfamily I [hydrothermal vent metagenome]|uniref:Metal-dependent hydrolases of the beta-lactamase superfamily I n=1 Tax=hydrothermal vent metagenome TaxID=652676 RepID=A0A3B0YQ94_9ZZZZ
MRFSSLGSGSRGNATLIEVANTCIMVDCGFSIKETEKRLARLEKQASQINAILITHEHTDHISGVARFARKHSIPVWLTPGTWRSGKLDKIEPAGFIDSHSEFTIGSILVKPFPVPHDALEPCQFVFSDGEFKIGVLTDFGSITPHIIEMLNGVDALMLECNHDREILLNGHYPESLKRRVVGDYGHLSNDQACEILSRIDRSRLQVLVATHLSEKNNNIDIVYNSLVKVLGDDSRIINIADQADGLAWQRVAHQTA